MLSWDLPNWLSKLAHYRRQDTCFTGQNSSRLPLESIRNSYQLNYHVNSLFDVKFPSFIFIAYDQLLNSLTINYNTVYLIYSSAVYIPVFLELLKQFINLYPKML
jgi:hypothetical protein